jgi:hypothetical protein
MLLHQLSANCTRRSGDLAHTPASWRDALLILYERILKRANTVRTDAVMSGAMFSRCSSDNR